MQRVVSSFNFYQETTLSPASKKISSYRSISNSLGALTVDIGEYAGEKNIQIIYKCGNNIEVIINKLLGCVVDDTKNLRCRNVYMSFSVHVLRRCVWRV